MKVKTQDLTGPALDWAVANCLGYQVHKDAILDGNLMAGWFISGHHPHPNYWMPLDLFTPSTNPAQGQPILEREGIGCYRANQTKWWAHPYGGEYTQHGPTMLIAGLRCFVASKLGDEVDVPDELM